MSSAAMKSLKKCDLRSKMRFFIRSQMRCDTRSDAGSHMRSHEKHHATSHSSNSLARSEYLYFDIQTIMGGRKIELGPDEVIFATTQLYVDIMGLYRYLLILIGGVHSNS